MKKQLLSYPLLNKVNALIDNYFLEHNEYPTIITSPETKTKIFIEYNTYLDLIDPEQESITRFPDYYRGILIKEELTEPFMKAVKK